MSDEKIRTKIGSMSVITFAIIVSILTLTTIVTLAIGFSELRSLFILEAANAWGKYGYDSETLIEMEALRQASGIGYVGCVTMLIDNIIVGFYIEDKVYKYRKNKKNKRSR